MPKYFSINFWPIHGRVNRILQRLFEQGLIAYFNKKSLRNIGVTETLKSTIADNLNITSIKLADLVFMIYVLCAGLLSGIITFFVEFFAGNCLRL